MNQAQTLVQETLLKETDRLSGLQSPDRRVTRLFKDIDTIMRAYRELPKLRKEAKTVGKRWINSIRQLSMRYHPLQEGSSLELPSGFTSSVPNSLESVKASQEFYRSRQAAWNSLSDKELLITIRDTLALELKYLEKLKDQSFARLQLTFLRRNLLWLHDIAELGREALKDPGILVCGADGPLDALSPYDEMPVGKATDRFLKNVGIGSGRDEPGYSPDEYLEFGCNKLPPQILSRIDSGLCKWIKLSLGKPVSDSYSGSGNTPYMWYSAIRIAAYHNLPNSCALLWELAPRFESHLLRGRALIDVEFSLGPKEFRSFSSLPEPANRRLLSELFHTRYLKLRDEIEEGQIFWGDYRDYPKISDDLSQKIGERVWRDYDKAPDKDRYASDLIHKAKSGMERAFQRLMREPERKVSLASLRRACIAILKLAPDGRRYFDLPVDEIKRSDKEWAEISDSEFVKNIFESIAVTLNSDQSKIRPQTLLSLAKIVEELAKMTARDPSAVLMFTNYYHGSPLLFSLSGDGSQDQLFKLASVALGVVNYPFSRPVDNPDLVLPIDDNARNVMDRLVLSALRDLSSALTGELSFDDKYQILPAKVAGLINLTCLYDLCESKRFLSDIPGTLSYRLFKSGILGQVESSLGVRAWKGHEEFLKALFPDLGAKMEIRNGSYSGYI